MALATKRPPAPKRVWRITKDNPMGTWVDAGAARRVGHDASDGTDSGWAVSSFELQYGLDIREAGDTIPADWLDEPLQDAHS